MILKNLKSWAVDPALDGLLFFAQTLDEMLFDYTHESYKAPALNTRWLSTEANKVIGDIKSKILLEGNIKPLYEELSWSLKNDKVAQRILGPSFNLHAKSLISGNISLHDAEVRIQAIVDKFNNQRYIDEIKLQLSDVVRNPTGKARITELAKLFVTELINSGYDQSYIFWVVNKYFFSDSLKITAPEQIQGFLDSFDFQKKEYDVVFTGSVVFKLMQKTFEALKAEVVDKLKPVCSNYPPEREFIARKDPADVFIVFRDVKAYTPQGARKNAEMRIELIADLFGYFRHRQRPAWSAASMIIRNEDNLISILNHPLRAMHKQPDKTAAEAASLVQHTIEDLPFSPPSIARFATAIDLHGVALEANAVENQLLDLWASFETLVPKAHGDGKDRIEQLCDSIGPFFRYVYITNLIRNLVFDLIGWNRRKIGTMYRNVTEGSNLAEKTAALLCLPGHQPLRDTLFAELSRDRFLLLKNRVYNLSEAFGTADSILSMIDTHSKRVRWHIMRIYRTRNLIIHSGEVPQYTDLLVEHLHSYIDMILNCIIQVSQKNKFRTIEQAMLEIRIETELHKEKLEAAKKTPCNPTNFMEFIFGFVKP